MLAPERRRRSDLVVAAAVALTALLVAGVVWLGSDARGTTSSPAQSPLPTPETASTVPPTFREIWRASSPATTTPVVAGGAVVAAGDDAVNGLDPASGNVAWSYSRDAALCGITEAWGSAVVVYRDDRGCSQVTELDGSTGSREAQRTSDADDRTILATDGTYVTARGDSRLEVWRSDLVRTLEYGRVDAPVNPGAQPRDDCTLLSSASTSSRLAVLENCPGDSADRLTTLDPAPDDGREPEEFGSSVVAALTGADGPVSGAKVLVTAGDRVALAVPARAGRPASVALFGGDAQPITEFDLPATITDGSLQHSSAAVDAGSVYTWWTGTGTVALSVSDLSPRWTVAGSLGPGTPMAGKLLLPVPNGISVMQPETGAVERTIAVDRGDHTGPVGLSVVGDTIVEQRGGQLVALSGVR